MTYALFNQTKQRWVLDADSGTGEVWTTVTIDSAKAMLDRINSIKWSGPARQPHNIIIKIYQPHVQTQTTDHSG